MTDTLSLDKQVNMYGRTAKEIDSEIEGMIFSDPQMYCTSLLSDLQEILACENNRPRGKIDDEFPVTVWPSEREDIRQTLNVVKRVLNVHMKNKGRHIDLGGSNETS